jgi:hypothetical protein
MDHILRPKTKRRRHRNVAAGDLPDLSPLRKELVLPCRKVNRRIRPPPITGSGFAVFTMASAFTFVMSLRMI